MSQSVVRASGEAFHVMRPSAPALRASNAPQEIPVIVIDDHAVVSAAIRQWSNEHGAAFRLAHSYASAEQFHDDQQHRPTRRTVVLYDLERGDERPNFDALQRLCEQKLPVIAYSRFTYPEVVLTCLDVGAMSYVAKSESRQQLSHAVVSAWEGRPFAAPTMRAARAAAEQGGRPGLTAQERLVVASWLRAKSKATAGDELSIAVSTVKTHVQRIRDKYDAVGRSAGDKASLLARALQDGLVGVHDF